MGPTIKLSCPQKSIVGHVHLTGSKSIANRALLIRALCGQSFPIENISESDDTRAMEALLGSKEEVLDTHHAGTTYRFLTAYLANQPGVQTLTGSERMKQRPIGPLVNALRQLGADIEYLGEPGYPPLRIGEPPGEMGEFVYIKGDISSQYLSALLMIAPTLPKGIKMIIEGDLVSRPYLMMTLEMMEYFGVFHNWNGNEIHVKPQKYIGRPFFVEADWSAASYYYGIAALAEEADITLHGLMENSMQGDSAVADMGHQFGITTTYEGRTARLIKKKGTPVAPFFERDFLLTPDIAQTFFAICAGLGTSGLFSGLQTLYIKETDRIRAFQTELAKVEVFLSKVPERFQKKFNGEYFMLEGKAKFSDIPCFDTYHDHRMAMSLAPLALLSPVGFNDPMVVSKSYPEFWGDLEKLGFVVEDWTK